MKKRTKINPDRQDSSRRRFLKQVSLWSAGLILGPPVFDIRETGVAQPGVSKLWVARGRDVSAMTRALVTRAGGMESFVKQGDTVVVKPNIGWDRTVEQGANTHPVIVAELALMAVEAGALKVKVFDRTCNEERRCYQNSGIKPALEVLGEKKIQCRYMDERKYLPVQIKKGHSLKEWSFYRDALEADVYINVPVAKHHSSAGLSIGLKNAMGVIGGPRGRLHYDLAARIADLNLVIQPDFTLVDATRVIVRNGPSGGSLSDVKAMDTMVLGLDPVAVDGYATTLFGMAPEDLESTVKGAALGLGQMNPDQWKVMAVET